MVPLKRRPIPPPRPARRAVKSPAPPSEWHSCCSPIIEAPSLPFHRSLVIPNSAQSLPMPNPRTDLLFLFTFIRQLTFRSVLSHIPRYSSSIRLKPHPPAFPCVAVARRDSAVIRFSVRLNPPQNLFIRISIVRPFRIKRAMDGRSSDSPHLNVNVINIHSECFIDNWGIPQLIQFVVRFCE